MKCYNCKKGEMKDWKGPHEFFGIMIEACGSRCDACGEESYSYTDMEHNEGLAIAAMVARGVRSGGELKLVRKAAGFRATELAEMLDVRPETVSRWERDEVEIPRTVAFAVGELFERPVITRRKLAALAS